MVCLCVGTILPYYRRFRGSDCPRACPLSVPLWSILHDGRTWTSTQPNQNFLASPENDLPVARQPCSMMPWAIQCGTKAVLRKKSRVQRSSRRTCAVLVQETDVSSLLDAVRMSSPWVIDVRAPIEYNKGHIPGAISVPLLDDEGRAAVGKAFKTTDRFEAMKIGLNRVKPAEIVTCLEQDHGCRPGTDVYVYCSRGGMRSESVAWLLNVCGYNAQKLKSGYKDYRKSAPCVL